MCHSAGRQSAFSVSSSEHLNVQESAGKLEGAGAHCYLWIESQNCLGWKTPSRSSSPTILRDCRHEVVEDWWKQPCFGCRGRGNGVI